MEDPSVVMAYGNLLEELVKTVPDGVAPWHEVDHHRQRRGTYKFVHDFQAASRFAFSHRTGTWNKCSRSGTKQAMCLAVSGVSVSGWRNALLG